MTHTVECDAISYVCVEWKVVKERKSDRMSGSECVYVCGFFYFYNLTKKIFCCRLKNIILS